MFAKVQGVVSNVVTFLVGKTGLPVRVQQVLTHAGIVFVVAFLTAAVGAPASGLSVGTLWALLGSAVAAGLSAAAHYLVGLLPWPQPKAAK